MERSIGTFAKTFEETLCGEFERDLHVLAQAFGHERFLRGARDESQRGKRLGYVDDDGGLEERHQHVRHEMYRAAAERKCDAAYLGGVVEHVSQDESLRHYHKAADEGVQPRVVERRVPQLLL